MATAPKEEEHFEVWEENWEVVQMFLRMGTQWNITMSGYSGLNYPALEVLLRLYLPEDPVALFEGLQIMELEALSLLHERQSADS